MQILQLDYLQSLVLLVLYGQRHLDFVQFIDFFIGYAGIVTCCIKWQACFIGFGLALPVIRWIIFGIGIFLFGLFIIDQLKEYGKFAHSGFV